MSSTFLDTVGPGLGPMGIRTRGNNDKRQQAKVEACCPVFHPTKEQDIETLENARAKIHQKNAELKSQISQLENQYQLKMEIVKRLA